MSEWEKGWLIEVLRILKRHILAHFSLELNWAFILIAFVISVCCENAPRSAFGKECSEKRIRGRDGLRVAVSKRDVLPHLEWQLTWVILNEPDNFWKLSGRSSRWNNSLSRRPAEVGIYKKKKIIRRKERNHFIDLENTRFYDSMVSYFYKFPPHTGNQIVHLQHWSKDAVHATGGMWWTLWETDGVREEVEA